MQLLLKPSNNKFFHSFSITFLQCKTKMQESFISVLGRTMRGFVVLRSCVCSRSSVGNVRRSINGVSGEKNYEMVFLKNDYKILLNILYSEYKEIIMKFTYNTAML